MRVSGTKSGQDEFMILQTGLDDQQRRAALSPPRRWAYPAVQVFCARTQSSLRQSDNGQHLSA